MIVCAGKKESFNFAQTIGIGLIKSAINMTRICLFDKPDFILFVGTAGSYGKYKIFDIVESRRSANLELSFLNGDSYTPLDNVLESENKMTKNDTIVNSSNYISTNFLLSKEFTSYGMDIENMEYFSIMQVAKEFEIPVAGIFIISNYTNKTAHEDFILNHSKCMELLTKYLEKNNIIKDVSRETKLE